MFKIGEFSRLTQVTIRMLRYYDEVNLLKPAFIDAQTGYRMYSIEQIPVLNRIIYLRDSGFLVNEIAEALQEDEQHLLQQLEDKYTEVEQAIKEEQEKLRRIELARQEIIKREENMHFNVTIKSIPSYQVLSLRRVIKNYYEEGKLWAELSEYAKQHRFEIEDQTFSIYHDIEYKEENVDVELCVPVKVKGTDCGDITYRDTEAVPFMASMMVYGDFSNIAGAYLSLAEWLQKNEQYKMIGASRQIVHRGPWNEQNPEHYLIELQIPIHKNSSI